MPQTPSSVASSQQPQLCLKKTPGVPRVRTQFWSGRESQRDLEDIRRSYSELFDIGKPPSTSLIVRRSLNLLASHLRTVQVQSNQTEIDHETDELMRHINN